MDVSVQDSGAQKSKKKSKNKKQQQQQNGKINAMPIETANIGGVKSNSNNNNNTGRSNSRTANGNGISEKLKEQLKLDDCLTAGATANGSLDENHREQHDRDGDMLCSSNNKTIEINPPTTTTTTTTTTKHCHIMDESSTNNKISSYPKSTTHNGHCCPDGESAPATAHTKNVDKTTNVVDVEANETKPPPAAAATTTTKDNDNDADQSVTPAAPALDLTNVHIEYKEYESELQMHDIMRLIQAELSEPYSIYTYRYFIYNWPKLCFLAAHGNEYVGAIVCKLDMHMNVRRGYIAMLAVRKEYRKLKIGTTLVQKAIEAMLADRADEVVLETEMRNLPALRLYENLGFVRDKRLFRYYLNGVDALRLKLWFR